MRGRHFAVLAVIISFVLIFSSSVQASSGMKNIKAYFNNIKVIVNGKQQASTPEPFIYDNTTYVPIRLVSTGLGANVYWDSNQKAVVITGNAQQNQALQQQIADLKNQLSQKESQIAQLTQQNAYLQSNILALQASLNEKEKQNSVNEARDLENYLYDEYSRWKGMDFDFNVSGDENALEVTIEIDLSNYRSKWNSISQTTIKNWLNDIFDYVQDVYPNADFSGTIENTDKGNTLVRFNSSGNKLAVTFKYSVYDFIDLEDDLNNEFSANLDYYNSRFGDMTANISVDGDEDNEEIYITIEIDTSDYGDEWEAVKETTYAEKWIKDIVNYVLNEFEDYDVSGEIINQDGDTMADFDVSSSGNVSFDWDYTY